jgi:hypothetical protein
MLLSRWVLSTLFSLSTSCAIFAQVSIHGSLRGQITDSSGSVVPGAVLTLTNLDNNNSSSATADEAGQYLFARLVPGRYALLVEKSGFQKIVRDRIVIAVNDAAVADIVLTIGAVSETVHVSAETDIVRSQNVEVSMLVTEQRIRELPLNGKNFQRLVLLAPGVAGGNPNNPAVSGARALTNTYTIDGTSANDERAAGGLALDGGGAAGLSGASPNMVSTEAVREFNIITSNADATFGRGSGGQVNIITKSGTNDWHGSAYEYLRNDVFDARDFFNFGPFRDSSGRAVVPPFKQNLFGASLGGPLRKDRHFVFGNYEGFRQRLERTASATVPNGDLINVIPGDLRSLYRSFYVDRGIVPATGVPANGTFVALPAATLTAAINGGFNPTLFDGSLANGEAGQVILSTTNTQNVDQDAFLIRTDHRLTDKLNASFRYGFAEPKLLFNQRAVAGITQENLRRWQSVSAQALYTISARHLLEVRGGVLRSRMRDRPRDGVESRFVALGVDPQIGLTSIVLGSPLSQLQIPGALGFVDNQTVPQGSAVHTWTSKSLTLRIGLDLRRNILNVLRISNAPFYQFSGFVGTNGLIGANRTQPQAIAIEASGTLYGSPKGPTTPLRGWRNTEQEYFAQLDWRVRPDVTVNLGVRYAYFGVMSEVNGAAANLYAVDPSGRLVADLSPFAFGRFANVQVEVTDDHPFYQRDRNNFQPRIGLAWDLGGRGRTVVRAGYGIFADRQVAGLWEFGAINFPFAFSAVFTNLPFVGVGTLPFTPTTPTQSRLIDPTLRSPYTQRFNLAVEQALDRHTSVSAAYVGALGRKLYRFLEPNGQGAVPQQFRPDQRYSRQRYTTNATNSEYQSLQIFARRRFAQGIDFSVAYTLAQSLDDYSNDIGATAQAPSLINLGANPTPGFQGGLPGQWVERPVRSDWGLSDFDVRHNLTVSHVIELPFGRGRRFLNQSRGLVDGLFGGFSIAGLAVLRSGEPLTLTLGSDAADIGFSGYPRPALESGKFGELYADGRFGRTQYLIPQTDANTRLGVPTPITDPFAQMERNALRSPNLEYYDLSLIKRLDLTERVKLTFEANVFNVFNHANFAAPNGTLSAATFGLVTATRAGVNPRQLQFGLKVAF